MRPLITFDRKLPLAIKWGRNRPEEVRMRPPSGFVRSLTPVEGQCLKRSSRRAQHASTRQRALTLLASQTLMSRPEIACMLMSDESHVRKVIRDFNESGFDSLRPRFGGRATPPDLEDEQRIVALAGARPDSLGVPCTFALAIRSRPSRAQSADRTATPAAS